MGPDQDKPDSQANNALTNEDEESLNAGQAPAKPSLARQVAPYVFALAILGYMFYKVDFQKVLGILKDAKASWIIGGYLTYCVVYYITDILSFYRAYNLFNTAISLAETSRLRLASFAVQAVNGALTEIMTVLYMFRVKRVPVLHSTSSAGFIYFNETYTLVFLLSYCAFFLPYEYRIDLKIESLGLSFWSIFQGVVIAAWVFLPLWLLFWRTSAKDKLPKLRDSGVMTAFNQATVLNYLEVFLCRFSNNFISVFVNILMLKALNIDAPVALLFAAVPIMVNVAYWPVSAGGFGGPQLVAHFLLKGYASEEAVFAYSVVWSALFFLSRTLTGLPFIRPVYKAAFKG